jgi:hypothetical protein
VKQPLAIPGLAGSDRTRSLEAVGSGRADGRTGARAGVAGEVVREAALKISHLSDKERHLVLGIVRQFGSPDE